MKFDVAGDDQDEDEPVRLHMVEALRRVTHSR